MKKNASTDELKNCPVEPTNYGSVENAETTLTSQLTLSKGDTKKPVPQPKSGITPNHHGEGNSAKQPPLSGESSGNTPGWKPPNQNGDAHVSKKSPDWDSAAGFTPKGQGDGGGVDESERRQLVEIERQDQRQLTNTEATVHLFKIFTGPSTIGMPAVMKNGGLLFGAAGFLVIGYLATYGNILVVNCGRLLCKRTGKSALRYEEMMELAILSYSESKWTRRLATIVRYTTVAMLCLCQFGILAFYIQVIGTLLQYLFDSSDLDYDLPLWVTKIFIALCLVPYSWMKNLKILSWFSLLANFSILVCVVTILQYACRNLQPLDDIPWITGDPWTIPLFISASVFTVEGVPMLLPIENRVMNPDDYGGLCGIITLASTGNIIVNLCLGFYGYMSWGDHVPGNVLTALPYFWWYQIVAVLYGLMVFLTFTLQLFLPAEFLVTALKQRIKNELCQKYMDIIARTLLVIAAYLMTILVSDLELIMGLTGAFCSVPLLFLFPALGEVILTSQEPGGLSVILCVKNGIMFTFGLVTFIAGGFMGIRDVIEHLRSSS